MNKLKPSPDVPEVLIGPVRFPGDGGIGRVVSRGSRICPESWTPSGWIEGGFEMVDLAQSRTATPDDLKAAGMREEIPRVSESPEIGEIIAWGFGTAARRRASGLWVFGAQAVPTAHEPMDYFEPVKDPERAKMLHQEAKAALATTPIQVLATTERSEDNLLIEPGIVDEVGDGHLVAPEPASGGFADDIAEGLAEEVCQRITTQTRVQLQSMPEQCRLSGDDSILKDFWEELCVQMQSGLESECWCLYEDTVRTIVTGLVGKLAGHEAKAIWLKTDDAIGCFGETERLETEWATSAWDEAIVDYIINEHIYPDADRFRNERTRAYLDRSMD